MGSASNNCTDVSKEERLIAGLQFPVGGILSKSIHINPDELSMFGWYTFVKNFIKGGSKGYLLKIRNIRSIPQTIVVNT